MTSVESDSAPVICVDARDLPARFVATLERWANIELEKGTSAVAVAQCLDSLAKRYRAGEITLETVQ